MLSHLINLQMYDVAIKKVITRDHEDPTPTDEIEVEETVKPSQEN